MGLLFVNCMDQKWYVNMYVFVTIISTLTLKTIKKRFIMKMKHFIDKYKYEWLKRSLFTSLLGRWCYWCMSCKTFFDLLQWRILSKMIIGIQKNIRITIAIINLKVSPIFHLGSLDSEPKMLPITLRYFVHVSNTNYDINVLTDRNTIRTLLKMYVGSTVFASFLHIYLLFIGVLKCFCRRSCLGSLLTEWLSCALAIEMSCKRNAYNSSLRTSPVICPNELQCGFVGNKWGTAGAWVAACVCAVMEMQHVSNVFYQLKHV